MRLVKIGLTVFVALALVISCSSKLAEEEYYDAAKTAYNEEKYAESIQSFKLIIEHYPDGKRSSEALFMLGFINANDLKNYDEAGKFYKQFIEKYPAHELADDAQYELNNLGKDINDLPMFQNIAQDSVAN